MGEHPVLLLVGLGNPGPQYDRTRHNVGFMALDGLAAAETLTWKTRGRGVEAHWHTAGHRVVLLKPLTFMNLSGFALTDTLNYYKIPLSQAVVIADEVALPLGALRLRPKGSAGGHNGLRHIIGQTGTDDFWRLRLGVGGKKHPGMALTDHVLGRFDPGEMPRLQDMLARTQDCLRLMTTEGPTLAMSRFNSGPEGPAAKEKKPASQEEPASPKGSP